MDGFTAFFGACPGPGKQPGSQRCFYRRNDANSMYEPAAASRHSTIDAPT